MGINIDKFFMPSVANVIGTDLSTYKIVSSNQFACNLMHVGRDEKMPIAILPEGSDPIIVSPAYLVFEIKIGQNLMSQYLMMWFRRTEFDRLAWFYTDADVRGGLDRSALLDITLPIPSIEEQRRVVSEYEALTQRVKINNQLIAKLEDTAQTIYRKMFVDGIDEKHLPEGWRMGTLGDIAEIIMGQSPDGRTYNNKGEGAIFYQGRTDFGIRFPYARMYTTQPTRMAKLGDVLLSVRAPVGDLNIAPHDCCIGRGLAAIRSEIKCNAFMFYLLQTKDDEFNVSNDDGTVFGSVNKEDLFGLLVLVPTDNLIVEFENKAKMIDNRIEIADKELRNLTELQSLLLAKMGQKIN